MMRHQQVGPCISKSTRAVLGLCLAFLIATGLGCGDTRVVTNVDVASFLATAESNPSYGVNPPIPPGVPRVTIPIGPTNVNIPEGLDELAEVEDADLGVRAIVVNETGTGQLDLLVYFGRPGEDPFANAPAGVFSAQLIPGTATTIEQTVALASEVQGMFEDSEVQIAYELRVDGSQSTDPMLGSMLIEKLALRIVHDPNIGS